MKNAAWILSILFAAGTATGFLLYSNEVKAHDAATAALAVAKEDHRKAMEDAEKQRNETLGLLEAQRAKTLAEHTAMEAAEKQHKEAIELLGSQQTKALADLKTQQDTSDRRNAAERELDRRKQSLERLSDELKVSAKEMQSTQVAFTSNPSQAMYDVYVRATADTESKLSNALTQAKEGLAFTTSNTDLEPSTRKKALDNKDQAEKAIASLTPVLNAVTLSRTGIRHADFDVQANEEWQAFPLQIAEGETVCVEAKGQWRWGRNIGGNVGSHGENGDASYRIVSNLGNGALVARVQGLADLFAACPSFSPRRSGTLQFQINDSQVRDNSGALSLSVWVLPNVKP